MSFWSAWWRRRAAAEPDTARPAGGHAGDGRRGGGAGRQAAAAPEAAQDAVAPQDGIAVELRGLVMRFGAVEALRGLDARIPAGLITGLVGPDGAGKTTLLRLLAGLMEPAAGQALLFGRPAREVAADAPNSIGYMPQRFGLYEDLSVMANLRLHARLRGLEGEARDALFDRLRCPGMDAEDAMHRATGNVNTHKGAIFSLGIVCAAAGRLLGRQERLTPAAISATSAAMTSGVLAECRNVPPNVPLTNGLRLYGKGIHGARGEAASGFSSVLRYGLPSLERELAAGASIDRAGALTLIRLMAKVFDTNIISRSSLRDQYALQDRLQGILAADEAPSRARLRELDAWLVAGNISPGGCADLLGLSWMLYFLRRDTALEERDQEA